MSELNHFRTRTDVFLEKFFSPPNAIGIAEVQGGRWDRVRPFVEDLRGSSPRATVLPCWSANRVHWYALAFSEAELTGLRDDLLAFVGPTYSTFRGNREPLDRANPIEAAVLELTDGWAFRFTGPIEKDDAKPIWAGLELMRAVLARRPDRALEAPRPTGRVLRDFYMALRAGNAASAESQLRYLTESNRLDPLNALFLRVQALAAFGDWTALLSRPELPDLLEMRRPVSVSEALLRAVYHSELEQFEDTGAVDAAIEHFRSSVLPRYGMIMTRRAGIRAQAAVKLLMFGAVAGETPDGHARDALLETPGLSRDDQLYLRLLSDRLPTTQSAGSTDRWALASEALAVGRFDDAFALLRNEPSSVRRARVLLECAYDLQTLEVERAAVNAVDTLEGDDQAKALLGRLHKGTYDRIVGRAPIDASSSPIEVSGLEAQPDHAVAIECEAVPSNWIEWLERLADEPNWYDAVDIARRGSTEWTVEELLAVHSGAAKLADRLASARESSTLQLALPHILNFYQRDPEWPRPELAGAYLWTLELLAMASNGGENDLSAFNDLAQAVLGVGATNAVYDRLVDSAELLSGDSESYHSVGWALDLLDLMVIYPCPRSEFRVRFLARVTALFRKYWVRLDESQWDMLRTLCGELGQREAFEALADVAEEVPRDDRSAIADPFQALQKLSVAVYTLTERAGKRIAEILEMRAPGVRVHLSHEKVGSESLRRLARSADIFVVATASAKHAATGFIDANRPRDLPTLRPAGKGTASMLRALYEYLRSAGGSDAHAS